MSDLSVKTVTGVVTVLLAALLVGACASDKQEARYMGQQPREDPVTEGIEEFLYPGKWEQLPRVPQNLIETVTFEHEVTFEPGQTSLSPEERRRLLNFLSESGVEPNERIRLAVPPMADGKVAALRAGQLASVRDELSRLGYSVSVRESDPLAAEEPNGVALTVSRAIVIPPDCTVPQPVPGYRPQLIKGCANTTALGLMVADPNDLLRGRDLAPGDAEFLGAGVERYRTNQITPLSDTESTTE